MSDVLWRNYCKIVLKLQRSGKLAEFQNELSAGRLPRVAEPRLMTAAIHLVSGLAAAEVRPWDWLPAPSADELADPAAWAAQRLAAQRTSQEDAERIRGWDRMLARAFGEPRSTGNGSGKAVHLQRPRRSLDELTQRLEQAMSRPGFQRQWLDPHSPHYVSDARGGISNKQVILMAHLIVKQEEQRSFDDNWKIVTDYMNARKKRVPQARARGGGPK
jgi:hypothetical protein